MSATAKAAVWSAVIVGSVAFWIGAAWLIIKIVLVLSIG